MNKPLSLSRDYEKNEFSDSHVDDNVLRKKMNISQWEIVRLEEFVGNFVEFNKLRVWELGGGKGMQHGRKEVKVNKGGSRGEKASFPMGKLIPHIR